MITYNPKDWWKLIFYLRKADTFRKLLPAMLAVMAYTALFYILEIEILHVVPIKNPVVVHSLVGFVLSLLLVFRTNTAYERWWEGRKLWGSFTNNARNLAIKLSIFLVENKSDREFFRVHIGNYLVASKDKLRASEGIKHLEELGTHTHEYFMSAKHVPNAIGKIIFNKINELYQQGRISGEQLIILNNEFSSFADNLGGCERIKSTPIPASYNIFIKKIIFMYVFSMPIGFVQEFSYWAIPIVAIVFYAFAGIELIAEEIEDPFGKDNNDLELDQICKNVKQNLAEILA